MPPVLLIGRIPAASKEGRDKVIAGLGKIADYAKEHDPETTKHATHVSHDSSDETTVWAIEEYTSQEACDKHMDWPAVVEFLDMFQSSPGLLAGAPEIWHSSQQLYFTRPEVGKATNPFIVLAKLVYEPEKFNEAFNGWKAPVAHTEANENGVLTYSIGKDVEYANRLTFVEVYESEKYLFDVHMKGAALQKKIQEEDSLRAGEPDIAFLKHVARYWYK